MRTLFILATLLMLLAKGRSQPFVDVFKINYNYQPGFGFEEGDDGEVTFQNLEINLNVPIVLDNQDVILINAVGEQWTFEDRVDELTREDQLQSLTLRLGYRKNWSETWRTTLLLQSKLSGQLDDAESDMLQYGIIALMEQQQSEDFALRWGFYLNREFFGAFLVPIVGIDWRINEKWYAFGNFPITGTILRELSSTFQLGFHYLGLVTSYRLGDEHDRSYLHVASTDASLRADWYIKPKIVLQLNLGRTIGRYFRQYKDGETIGLGLSAFQLGDDRNQLNREIDDGWFAQVQLILRFQK